MKKHLITVIILIVTLLGSFFTVSCAEMHNYITLEDLAYLEEQMNECLERQEAAHAMAEAARALGLPEDDDIIVQAKQYYNEAYELYYYLWEDYETSKWTYYCQAYPSATTVWNYLHSCGYNDYVTAGILGNLMAEVGGNTLALQYDISNNTYYGMCQWNKQYYPNVIGKDLLGQCLFLTETLPPLLDGYGHRYAAGFDYNAFCNLTDERQAAEAFARCYERCGGTWHETRQNNATAALQFFTQM